MVKPEEGTNLLGPVEAGTGEESEKSGEEEGLSGEQLFPREGGDSDLEGPFFHGFRLREWGVCCQSKVEGIKIWHTGK